MTTIWMRGGGAFYGPKIDIKIKDALGMEWQCTTVQFDFNLPERFDLNFQGSDGGQHRPYMVHRAILGSIERFLGILVEHYAGAFPLWLAPVQAVVIPIADRHIDYALQTKEVLRSQGFRVEVDARGERMNLKIRDAQLQKVPLHVDSGGRGNGGGAVCRYGLGVRRTWAPWPCLALLRGWGKSWPAKRRPGANALVHNDG